MVWAIGSGEFRKECPEYGVCKPCGAPMKPGILCMEVALEMGDVSQGSSGRELLMGPTLVGIGGLLKDSMGESCSFMVLASIFSCLLHFALLF